jgi:hypothetical protein
MEETQVHHVVHQKFGKHPFVIRTGISINHKSNLIRLPTIAGAVLYDTFKSVHQGSHYATIVARQERQLDDLEDAAKSNNWSTDQCIQAFKQFREEERLPLLSGVPLNKHVNPRYKGPTIK